MFNTENKRINYKMSLQEEYVKLINSTGYEITILLDKYPEDTTAEEAIKYVLEGLLGKDYLTIDTKFIADDTAN